MWNSLLRCSTLPTASKCSAHVPQKVGGSRIIRCDGCFRSPHTLNKKCITILLTQPGRSAIQPLHRPRRFEQAYDDAGREQFMIPITMGRSHEGRAVLAVDAGAWWVNDSVTFAD